MKSSNKTTKGPTPLTLSEITFRVKPLLLENLLGAVTRAIPTRTPTRTPIGPRRRTQPGHRPPTERSRPYKPESPRRPGARPQPETEPQTKPQTEPETKAEPETKVEPGRVPPQTPPSTGVEIPPESPTPRKEPKPESEAPGLLPRGSLPTSFSLRTPAAFFGKKTNVGGTLGPPASDAGKRVLRNMAASSLKWLKRRSMPQARALRSGLSILPLRLR